MHFGKIEGQASRLVQCSWIGFMAKSDNSERLGMFNNRYGPLGGGVEVSF